MVLPAVSTHSRLKAAGGVAPTLAACVTVSTHSRLKAAGAIGLTSLAFAKVSTHSRLKAAGLFAIETAMRAGVSTHSRLKAAGAPGPMIWGFSSCFNTQPPEGGWKCWLAQINLQHCFNTQPPEGGWFFQRRRQPKPRWFQHTAA